jgi:hypothetical protein
MAGPGVAWQGRQITETGKHEHHPPRPRSRHPLRTLASDRRRTQRRHPRQGRTANPLLLRLWRPSLGRAHTTAERSQQILRLLGERAPRGVHEAQSCATEEFHRMSYGRREPTFNGSTKRPLPTLFNGAGLPLTRSLSKKTAPPFCPRQPISIFGMGSSIKTPGAPNPAPDGIWPRYGDM